VYEGLLNAPCSRYLNADAKGQSDHVLHAPVLNGMTHSFVIDGGVSDILFGNFKSGVVEPWTLWNEAGSEYPLRFDASKLETCVIPCQIDGPAKYLGECKNMCE
jgi:hypothetical protein